MKFKKLLLLNQLLLFVFASFSQVVNMNPDPNGEPWWSGGVPKMTLAMQYEYLIDLNLVKRVNIY